MRVAHPTGTLFSGDVCAVSLMNDMGPFDILQNHINFIAPIKEKIVIHTKNKEQKVIAISTGIVNVNNNVVQIFLHLDEKGEII